MLKDPPPSESTAGTPVRLSHQALCGRRFRAGVVTGFLIVFVAWVIVEQTTLVDWLVAPLSLPDTTGRAEAIVVLGAAVTQFCTLNQHGLHRVFLAADLYHAGRAPLVVFLGGRRPDSPCSVAEQMAALAERLGVPRDRIRVELLSQSTWENVERGDALLRPLGVRRILLVTSRPHLSRAEACFRRFGYAIERAGVPSAIVESSNTSLLRQGLREYAAWAYYWLRGRMSDTPAPTAITATISASATLETTMPDSPLANPAGPLVILGASYARGWRPALDGLTIENRGVAGQQSFELLARFDQDVVTRRPRAVILWGFINDVFRSPRPQITETLARARDSFDEMITRARRAGIEPIIATEITAGLKAGATEALANLVGGLLGKQGYHDYVNRHVMDTNAWLRERARQERLMLLDFEQVLAGAEGGVRRRGFTAADGSHVTATGYAALSAYALPLLESHFERPASAPGPKP